MLFNSIEFAIFLPLVVGLYFWLKPAFRWMLLLAASLYFYMCFVPEYALILLTTITVDYFAARKIETASGVARKAWLALSLTTNFGFLIFFKYAGFITNNVDALAKAIGWNYPVGIIEVLLPIGISFHVFQSVSYTIEVYRGTLRAERHFGYLALFVLYFPQLVAGPIERAQNLLHQLHETHHFEYNRAASGLRLVLLGLFKKVVIADHISHLVNTVYQSPGDFTGPQVLLATYCFAIQIYCDFSGYTDIARGVARIMGVELMKNFDGPYLARSISEFWRRWHISLSTWFRDYLFIPLGGSRVAASRVALNLFIVFLVSGLWHGAAWTFVFWGALHGFYVVFSQVTASLRAQAVRISGLARLPRFHHALQIFITFHLVCLSWVFFRAENFPSALNLLRQLPEGWSGDLTRGIGFGGVELIALAAVVVVWLTLRLLRKGREGCEYLGALPVGVRWAAYLILGMAIVLLGAEPANFVYFQF
ncbi:MAG: MBOAT family O-acyltransferase [Chthoniobacterales bacterium]